LPVLEANNVTIARIKLPQPKLDFLSDDSGWVIALEAQPSNLSPLVVVPSIFITRTDPLGGTRGSGARALN